MRTPFCTTHPTAAELPQHRLAGQAQAQAMRQVALDAGPRSRNKPGARRPQLHARLLRATLVLPATDLLAATFLCPLTCLCERGLLSTGTTP